jgi:hypothetical protein
LYGVLLTLDGETYPKKLQVSAPEPIWPYKDAQVVIKKHDPCLVVSSRVGWSKDAH